MGCFWLLAPCTTNRCCDSAISIPSIPCPLSGRASSPCIACSFLREHRIANPRPAFAVPIACLPCLASLASWRVPSQSISSLPRSVCASSSSESFRSARVELCSVQGRIIPSMAVVACDAVAEGTLLPVLTGHGANMALAVPAQQMKPFWNAAGSSKKFTVVGHRGSGKNVVRPEGDARPSIRENTIVSFNAAAEDGADFVEFDVQVSKDNVPVIFHDDLIHSNSSHPGTRISELTLQQFRALGPQTSSSTSPAAPLYRKTSTTSPLALWTADTEDSMCTLEEAFASVHLAVGFNVELKFDDDGSTTDAELHRAIDATLQVVTRSANGRMIVFSSFHPDAVAILRNQMAAQRADCYPVLFLTNGGNHRYADDRRNSIDAALELCREAKLHGVVSEVQAVLRRAEANDQTVPFMAQVKSLGLKFFTYGTCNNEAEVVLKQQSWGIDGVIVDHVKEIVGALRTETVPLAQQSGEPASPSTTAFSRRGVPVA